MLPFKTKTPKEVLNMTVPKELNALMKNIDRISNGQAKFIKFENNKDTADVYIELSPLDGLYKGGHFLFMIQLYDDFPSGPPAGVNCMTPIIHPNINLHDTSHCGNNVCLNILDDWYPSIGLTGLVAGLLYLLYNPQLDDPYVTEIGALSMEELQRKVRAVMNGEETNTYQPSNFDEMLECLKGDKSEMESATDNEMEEDMETEDDCSELQTPPLGDDDLKQLFSLIQHQNSYICDTNDAHPEKLCSQNSQQTSQVNSTNSENFSKPIESKDIITLNMESGALQIFSEKWVETPFNVPTNFQEQFCGYKLTKHGTTVIRDNVMDFQNSDIQMVPPFVSLTKRFTV